MGRELKGNPFVFGASVICVCVCEGKKQLVILGRRLEDNIKKIF